MRGALEQKMGEVMKNLFLHLREEKSMVNKILMKIDKIDKNGKF